MTKMTVTFDLPDPDVAGQAAMAIEDAVSEFDVEGIEWDTE